MLVWWVPKYARLAGTYGPLTHFTASTVLTSGQLHFSVRLKVAIGTHPEKTQIKLSMLPLAFEPASFYTASKSKKVNVSSSHGWKALDKNACYTAPWVITWFGWEVAMK